MATPTKYKPEHCEAVIECLAKGHSVAGFAGSIGVATTNVYQWIKRHEEFAAAFEIAKAKAVLHWEKVLLQFAGDGKGNAAAIIFALKNRATDEWRDVHKLEHTGKDGEPIKTEDVSARDEITRRISGIVARSGAEGDPRKLN